MFRTPGALLAAALLALPAAGHAQERPSYQEVNAATAPVADAYFKAYVSRDWDALEPLLAEDGSFLDPTAKYVFGGPEAAGKAAVMERFRQGYSSITHMAFAPTRRIVAGDTALYEGDLAWGLDLGEGTRVDTVTPMVIVLTVEGGKVVRHRDYVDYAPFIAALRKARGG